MGITYVPLPLHVQFRKSIMSAYNLRRQKEAEKQRLEAKGYAKRQSVPERVTLKKLQQASEKNLQRALLYLDDFYKHELRAAPVIDQVRSLPPVDDIAQWVRYVFCMRQGRSADIIQRKTMLQIWHDLRGALYHKTLKCYSHAEIKRISTVRAHYRPTHLY